jgi:acetoin utilization protein AcuB
METIDKYMSESPHTVGVDQPLIKALDLMHEFHVRHLPVLDGGKLVGLLSDRDIHLVESLSGTSLAEVQVGEAMTPDPYTASPLAPLDEVVSTMARHKYGSTVVVDHGQVRGIFTAVDGLAALSWLLERGKL